jgi:NAD(P)-dependent dehydrogenase (short-subunit alcohol dehydrogenase family)
MNDIFDLTNRVAIITGGAGLLGLKHAEAIASRGGIPVLVDLAFSNPITKALEIATKYNVDAIGLEINITKPDEVQMMLDSILARYNRIDILINNAANNPKVEAVSEKPWSRLENFPLNLWEDDIAVGLTGAFLCSQIVGSEMARRKKGVILNIASDLAVIAPDQRIYRKAGIQDDQQPVKPVTYSVVKAGIVGLTRYLATYWANLGVRVNAISPGGVYNNQPDEFVQNLTNLIPMGRMADVNEYQGAILFLCSDASSYMTGFNLVMDGGRSSW